MRKKKKDLDTALGVGQVPEDDLSLINLDTYQGAFDCLLEEFPEWGYGMRPLYIAFTKLDEMVVLASPHPITPRKRKAFEKKLREELE